VCNTPLRQRGEPDSPDVEFGCLPAVATGWRILQLTDCAKQYCEGGDKPTNETIWSKKGNDNAVTAKRTNKLQRRVIGHHALLFATRTMRAEDPVLEVNTDDFPLCPRTAAMLLNIHLITDAKLPPSDHKHHLFSRKRTLSSPTLFKFRHKKAQIEESRKTEKTVVIILSRIPNLQQSTTSE